MFSRSQWPRSLRRGSTAARLLGLWVRISPGVWMSVCVECCVLSGRGLYDGLITRPEKPYRMWCVWSRHLMNEAMASVGPQRHKKENVMLMNSYCYVCSVLCILFHCVVLCIVLCKCELFYCQRVSTELQFTNISNKIFKKIKFTLEDKWGRIYFYCCSKPSPKYPICCSKIPFPYVYEWITVIYYTANFFPPKLFFLIYDRCSISVRRSEH